MSSPELGDFPQREVRIGLVLYGGVALAVYINGVAQEMLRLVQASRGLERGEEVNAYAQLLRRANAKAMVDIISGTSAGGINGVALAKALCIGASMESLAQVWKQKAELGNLLNSPRRRDARSLLNEEYYQSVILDVLNDMDRTASDTPLVNALDLFISATDLHGEVLELKDFLEQDVKTRQYRKKFHLKFRTSNYNPVDRGLGDDRNDFHASRNRHLVDICRATSSFPVALRPTPIQPDQTEGLDLFPRPMESSTLYFSDGGILNNKPFGDAIKAIFGRSNKPAVDRILFYVEPDPESFRPPKVGEALAEPNFIEIAGKALSGIPRYQSIATDLQDLNNRNGRIREFQVFRAHLEDKLWSEFSDRLTQLKDKGLRSTDYRDFLGQQVAHSGYQLIKLQRTEAHLGEMFDWVLNLRPLDPIHAAARSMIKEQVSELAKNEEAFLRAFDTEYRVRRYYHLIELLEEFAGNKHSAADREALENLKLRLWAGFDRARDIEWRAWTTTHEGWFRDSLQHLQSRSPAISAAEVHNLLQQMQSRLTQEYDALHRQGKETADALEDSVRRIAQSASSHDSIAHSLIQISQAFEQFEYWDMFLYPITALADLGERDIIDWVRISPGDTTYVLKRPEDKLAGETLFHFGGFLEGKWRANDIMWGRLDTAEMLVRTILKDAPQEAQNAIIHQIQAQIASEELRPGITNSSGFSYKRYLEEEYRVGTEGIEDVSMAKRVNLAVQSASVLRNMFRTASQDADTSMAVRSIANVLSTVLTWLTRFVTPVAEALFSDDSLRRRGYLLALVGLAGWGLVTLALWILGVIEPDPRVLGLSAVAVLPLLIYSYVKNKLLGSILSIVFLLLLVGAILLWARPDSWIAKLLGTG